MRLLSLLALLCLTLVASRAEAQPLRLHGYAAAAHAVSGHQKDELGWGAAGMAAGEYAVSPEFGVALELGWLWMGSGDAPRDPTLEPLGNASAFSAAAGLRYRPFAMHFESGSIGAEGLWLGAGLGLANTDSLNRLFLDAHLGYDFMMSHGKFGIGPAVGFYHVQQPSDAVRPDDANIVLLGIHSVFDFAGIPERQEQPEAKPDRDGDGVPDAVDQCPDDPEDKDDFQDEDGCPDEDDDGDGIKDQRDKCPLVAEDKDGFEDDDGCPDPDNDKDGFKDEVDKCPDEPEDKDGFEDDDGCPEPDNDNDGILDAQDLCPDEPETKNNYADHDGCPDEEQVRVLADKIVLDDRVHFATNKHTIRVVSYPLLGRLAKLLRKHPEYTHISIEGHADSRGTEEYNQDLSEKRAASVRDFLIRSGIDSKRLSSKGFGSTRPIVDKNTEDAWMVNRRVEFVVTRARKVGQGGAAAPPGSPVPLKFKDKAPPGGSGAGDPAPPPGPAPPKRKKEAP